MTTEEIEHYIFPVLGDLVLDPSSYVRSTLALQISDMAEPFGKKDALEKLMSVLMQLLKDEHSDVRLNVISKLEKVNQGIVSIIFV